MPTVDAAAVLDGGGGHFPARHYATGELLTYCDRCDCAWRGDEQTGGCETVVLARRVIALEALLRSVEWVNTADAEVLYCPRCGWTEADGHSPACPLGTALADARVDGS